MSDFRRAVEQGVQRGYAAGAAAVEAGAAAAAADAAAAAAAGDGAAAAAYEAIMAAEPVIKQRSYQAGPETTNILQELRSAFGLATDSAVIRRSLALARVIARAARGEPSIVILGKDGTRKEIILRD